MTLRMRLVEVLLDPYHKIVNNEAIYTELLKFTLEYTPKLTVSHQEIRYIAKLITFNRR